MYLTLTNVNKFQIIYFSIIVTYIVFFPERQTEVFEQVFGQFCITQKLSDVCCCLQSPSMLYCQLLEVFKMVLVLVQFFTVSVYPPLSSNLSGSSPSNVCSTVFASWWYLDLSNFECTHGSYITRVYAICQEKKIKNLQFGGKTSRWINEKHVSGRFSLVFQGSFTGSSPTPAQVLSLTEISLVLFYSSIFLPNPVPPTAWVLF